jgi:hypothetical protein
MQFRETAASALSAPWVCGRIDYCDGKWPTDAGDPAGKRKDYNRHNNAIVTCPPCACTRGNFS